MRVDLKKNKSESYCCQGNRTGQLNFCIRQFDKVSELLILKSCFKHQWEDLIYYFTYFSTVVPSNSCMFLSCKPLVANTTFLIGLVS